MPFAPEDAARLGNAASKALKALEPAGFAVGVVEGADLVFAEGFGFADIESGRPQHPELRQRIGSITKTMVGLCTMALVDEGRLGLDDRLVDHIPELTIDGDSEAVTLRHLLTHTAGIGEVPTAADARRADDSLWSDQPDDDLLGLFPDGLTLEAPPGTKWSYANLGFALVGEIVARLEGAPIAEVVRRRVFEPLGMANSDLLDRPHPDLTTCYHHRPTAEALRLAERAGVTLPVEPTVDGTNIRGTYRYIRGGGAAGAVQSTIPDMARYASALLARGAGIVRPGTFDQMIAPQWRPDERLESWGLTFQRMRCFGEGFFGHGGGVLGGWNTMLIVSQPRNLALLVHANTAFEGMGPLTSQLLAALIGAEPRALTGAPAAQVIAAAPGVYESPGGVLTNFRIMASMGRLMIKAEDSGLTLYARRGAWRDGKRLYPGDPNDPDFLIIDDHPLQPSPLVLVRDIAGAVVGLRCDRLVEMVRTEAVEPWA
ncbi:MAG TPA: serine hydrolase domain-containing protein [Caulobacteraceae bacterium]|nr:serine hydrolase domain-containing protein [Caulobacteraceae bacterium]